MIKKFDNPVFVTEPLRPDKEKILSLFSDVIDSGWITNMGRQHEIFENEIAKYLNVDNVSVFNNGTTALIAALKSLDLPYGSEVITTPFTFVATTHAIVWNGLKPIFADIDEKTMTLSPEAIEKAITAKTSAILPVHVYGFPCDVESIEEIANKYNLKVIYDGAHAFGTNINGESICNWGDVTMLSFHSTKLFNSIEGGALVYKNEELGEKLYKIRNFGIQRIQDNQKIIEGIKKDDMVNEIGINGKLNEFQAAWGIEVLKIVKDEQNKRREVAKIYMDNLCYIDHIYIPSFPENTTNSMQYFPIIIEGNKLRDNLYEELLKYNVYSRKYFFPLCSEFSCYNYLSSAKKDNLIVSHKIADNVLCLPFFGGLLKDNKARKISEIIKGFFDETF